VGAKDGQIGGQLSEIVQFSAADHRFEATEQFSVSIVVCVHCDYSASKGSGNGPNGTERPEKEHEWNCAQRS
jgi:hypothetical protein